MIGEVRDWEFGSPPCGWVFAIDVDPRPAGRAWARSCWRRSAPAFGAVACASCAPCWRSDNPLILSFFRSQGMTAGRLIPLETGLIGPQA